MRIRHLFLFTLFMLMATFTYMDVVAEESGEASYLTIEAGERLRMDLEKEMLAFKLQRADSWMFWMAVFMTLVAVLLGGVGLITPIIVSWRNKQDIEAINEEKSKVEKIRKEVERYKDEITAYHNISAELTNQQVRDFRSKTADNEIQHQKNRQVPYDDRVDKAQKLSNERKYEEAEKIWSELVEDKEVHEDIRFVAWMAIGDLNSHPVREGQDNFEKAVKAYGKALEMNINDAAALNNQGLVLLHLGKLEQALENFNRVVDMDPNNYGTYANRSNVYLAMGEIEKSIGELDKSVERAPNDFEKASLICQKGMRFFRLKKFMEAFDLFEQAKSKAPQEGKDEIATVIENFLSQQSNLGNQS